MRTEGTLKTWNDDRGFGFIVTAETKQEVFLHASALPQTGRRPQPGERLAFTIETGEDGRKRAAAATFLDPAAGNAPARPQRTPAPYRAPREHEGRHRRERRPRRSSASRWLGVAVLAACVPAFIGMRLLADRQPSPTPQAEAFDPGASTPAAAASSSGFRCDGRTHCSQMTSCAEARQFLRNCPNMEMDGDNDGIPCETQWCN